MPTRNISLTKAQDDYIADIVNQGKFQNASEAVRDALALWQKHNEEHDLKLSILRAELQIAIGELDRGEGTLITPQNRDDFFDKIDAEIDAELTNGAVNTSST